MADLYAVALGGALGIIGTAVGQVISGRRQNKQWLFENKKQEYRELLDVMSKAVRFIIDTRGGTISVVAASEMSAAYDAENDVFRVMEDRIFIADMVSKERLMDRWVELLGYMQNKRQPGQFIKTYTELRVTILRAAFKDLGIKISTQEIAASTSSSE